MEVALDLGPVAVFRDLAALGHLLHVVLQLAAALPRDLLVRHVATGVDGRLGTGRHGDVLIHGVDVESVLDVVDQHLTERLGELVRLAAVRGAVVDVVLHKLEERRVGAVHEPDALADDLTIHLLQPPKDDVKVHAQGVLAGPVPRRVVDTGLERAEDGLDARGIEVAVLGHPQVQLGLEDLGRLLRGLEGLVAGTDVHLEIPRSELQLLLEVAPLVAGQGLNGSRVHHHAATATGSRTGGGSGGEADASTGGVFLGRVVEERLRVCV